MRRPRGPARTPAGAAILAVYLGFAVMSLLQQPGRTTYDTRLELTERPGSFLASAFTLWQPDVNFGEVQNQANGYLFPQGLFFWLADLVHVAPWVTQRLWSALVVIAACEGMRRVGRAVDLPGSAAFLGGLVFALSPRLIGTSGVLTGEALPGALAPWVLLPMLLCARGRLATRPAVVISVAASVGMGGVNAVETGAALVPAGIFVLWAASRRLIAWRLVASWTGLLAAATLWWTVPLLVLGRYGPPFYEYVESAATTTSVVGWSEAVRGDSHWLTWLVLPDGRPWWPAAHRLGTDAVLVTVSTVIVALGLVGLARWQSRFRVPFAFSAAVGMAVLVVAHGGRAGTPYAGEARTSLDGSLQIFRNVHKFDPAVRIAVAIGAAALFAEVVAALDRRFSAGAGARWVVLPACAVLALGTPYVVNEGRTPGWSSIPDTWVAARDWLGRHADGGAVLVVPGTGFALQTWGATFDEPALALDIPHRVALTQAPLIPGRSLRFLSELNASITSAKARDLAEELARAGVSHVILRTDLDQVETGAPSPAVSEAALAGAGIVKEATFGVSGATPLTIYRVEAQEPELRATPLDDVLTVAGQPESVLALQEAGLRPAAVVLQGEAGWEQATDIVTDGAERREREFGSLYGTESIVLGADEPFRVKRSANDYPGVPGARQVVATYDGLASLRASSSRGYADTYGGVVVAEGPGAAIDSDPTTRWVTSPGTRPAGQWLRMTFRAPRVVHQVTVQPVVGDKFLAPVRQIRVEAGTQQRTLDVDPSGGTVTARFDGTTPVGSVTVRILRAGTAAAHAATALAGVHVDGLVPRAGLSVPEPLRPGVGFVFRTDAGARPCVASAFGPECDENRRRFVEEPAGLSRTVRVEGGDTVTMTGSVVARTTRRALRLLEPLGREQRVRASSVLGNDPLVSSRFAWDGSARSAWIPADTDAGPTLVFHWSTPHTVSGLRVTSPDPQATPARALLTTAEGQHLDVPLAGSAVASFPALRTRRLAVTFQRPEPGARLVIGEADLVGADATQPFDRDAITGAICGLGPHVVVDGDVHQTAVRGTLGDIVDRRPLRLTVCDPDRPGTDTPVRLGPGRHRISTPPTSEFQTVEVAGTARDQVHSGESRAVDVETWHGIRRTARVGPGPAVLVSMPANANSGWRARLDGRTLQAVPVDGWQQGWVVPAGSGGRLVIDFPPQHWYGAMIVAGLVPAMCVVLAALLLLLGRRRGARYAVPEGGPGSPATAAVVALVLLSALGVVAAVGALLALLGRRRAWPIVVGGLLVLASGIRDAPHAAVPADTVADVLAAGGFGLLFVSAVWGRSTER